MSSSYAHAPTRADGLDHRSAAQIKADVLEAQLATLRESATSDDAQLAQLEQQLEDAQDDLMGLLVADPNFEQEGDDLDQMAFDQTEDSDLEELDDKALLADGDDDDSHIEGVVEPPSSEEEDAGEDEDGDETLLDRAAPEPVEPPTEPASFSQIPAKTLHRHLQSQPIDNQAHQKALENAGQPLQVEIKANSMLYLPASWFHEVTSLGESTRPHMAFN